jgi:uncharacterized membrane protein YccC
VSWSWSSALRGVVVAAPAAVAAFFDVTLAAALAVGFLPVCARPLAPARSERLRSGVLGVLAAASIFLGGFLAQWPVAAVAGLALAGGLVGYAVVKLRRPALMVGLLLCLPLMAVGFSYPGTEKVAGLALDIVLGSAWTVLVLLAWPARAASTPAPSTAEAVPDAPPRFLILYGWVAGLVGATCAAIGFAADLEHVGWAPAAALLVMRPSPPTQGMRSLDRVADVVVGATAAIVLVRLDPPTWVYAAAIVLVVTAATATAASRWYVLPAFTTYLVFILLLARDPDDAAGRFWERLLETGLGVGVAALATFVVLPAIARRSPPSGEPSTTPV